MSLEETIGFVLEKAEVSEGECKDKYLQLAFWLQELKARRSNESMMEFSQALYWMQQGFKVRRLIWEGYWYWDRGTVMIHCGDDYVIDIRSTDDVAFTLSNVTAKDWVLVVED